MESELEPVVLKWLSWLIYFMKLKVVVKQLLWNEVRLLSGLLRSLSKLVKRLDMVLLSKLFILLLFIFRLLYSCY
ncbi:hypothetical protein L1987_13209 [Smallanthus sonchifolius]|uniref:Uncharacterized protein n=1 Tax=Smallanthus sonchifolius TaxID=185202 RepID=A0ACB9JGR2_9ASTR|nr:hypothetical protein L1987_13209 [Smallanthus sonchifolius]